MLIPLRFIRTSQAGRYGNTMIIISIILFLAGLTLVTFSIICFKKKKIMLGWISALISMFPLAIGGTLILSYFVIAPAFFQGAEYLQYQQHLQSPDKNHIFVLFYNYSGIGDPSWHVFKFSNDVDAKKIKILAGYTNKLTDEDKKWSSKILMWNWSEAGDQTENPHIEIIKDEYLVFIRGDIYHGLYDIKADKTLIDDRSPWHTFIYSDEYKAIQIEPTREERKRLLMAWKKKILHQPILDIIESNND